MVNDDLNNLNLMLARGIYRTQFESVVVPSDNTRGIQIGEGKCIAVILHLNRYIYNYPAVTEIANTDGVYTDLVLGQSGETGRNGVLYVYYGDRNKQQRELAAGETSPILFCEDLSEIYVKAPTFVNGDAALSYEYEIQLEIYHGKDDDDQ